MVTHNLKDLQNIPGKLKVGSFKPGQLPGVQIYYPGVIDTERFVHTVAAKYVNAMEYNRWRIENTLMHFYGKPLQFADKVTSELVYKIKEIMRLTGKSIKEIAKDFRNYLGYPCTFFRKEGARRIPVDAQRIMKAYEAMKKGALVRTVEKILYN